MGITYPGSMPPETDATSVVFRSMTLEKTSNRSKKFVLSAPNEQLVARARPKKVAARQSALLDLKTCPKASINHDKKRIFLLHIRKMSVIFEFR